MDTAATFAAMYRTATETSIRELASGILDPNSHIIRRGWFILGYTSHSPYWINAFDLCRRLHASLLSAVAATMVGDRSAFQAVPWSHETASYSFYLSGLVANCFDFRVGTDASHEEQLEGIIDNLNVDRVTIVGDLAVMGSLYYRAVEMLQNANVSVARVIVAVARPNPILLQNINRVEKRRIPWVNLLEFTPSDDRRSWVLRDAFSNELGRLPSDLGEYMNIGAASRA